jgi:hypothetical protein
VNINIKEKEKHESGILHCVDWQVALNISKDIMASGTWTSLPGR